MKRLKTVKVLNIQIVRKVGKIKKTVMKAVINLQKTSIFGVKRMKMKYLAIKGCPRKKLPKTKVREVVLIQTSQ